MLTEQEFNNILKNFMKTWSDFWKTKEHLLEPYIVDVISNGPNTYAGEIRFWFTVYCDDGRLGRRLKFFIRTKKTDVFDPDQPLWVDNAGNINGRVSTQVNLVTLRLLYISWLAIKRIATSVSNDDNMYKECKTVWRNDLNPLIQVQLKDNHLQYDVC